MTNDERKPARLVEIQLSELSLVDRPANPHARVTLFKRDDDKEQQMEMRKIGDDRVASFNSLEEAMAHLQTIGLSKSDAMSQAAREHPELLMKFNQQGAEQMTKAAEAAQPRTVNEAAVAAFEDRVDEIAKRHGLHRSQAMSKARERFPDEFRAYQEG